MIDPILDDHNMEQYWQDPIEESPFVWEVLQRKNLIDQPQINAVVCRPLASGWFSSDGIIIIVHVSSICMRTRCIDSIVYPPTTVSINIEDVTKVGQLRG